MMDFRSKAQRKSIHHFSKMYLYQVLKSSRFPISLEKAVENGSQCWSQHEINNLLTRISLMREGYCSCSTADKES